MYSFYVTFSVADSLVYVVHGYVSRIQTFFSMLLLFGATSIKVLYKWKIANSEDFISWKLYYC